MSLTNLVYLVDLLDSLGTMGFFGAVHFWNLGYANQAKDNRVDKNRQVSKVCLQFSLKNEVSRGPRWSPLGTTGLFRAVHFRNLGHANQARDNRGEETRQVCKLCKFVCNFPWKMKSRVDTVDLFWEPRVFLEQFI